MKMVSLKCSVGDMAKLAKTHFILS